MSPEKQSGQRSPARKKAPSKASKVMDREVELSSASDSMDDAPILASSSADEGVGDVEERIRQKAFEIYCSRNPDEGNDVDDWLAAERALRPSTSL
jgi:hypothetical protein